MVKSPPTRYTFYFIYICYNPWYSIYIYIYTVHIPSYSHTYTGNILVIWLGDWGAPNEPGPNEPMSAWSGAQKGQGDDMWRPWEAPDFQHFGRFKNIGNIAHHTINIYMYIIYINRAYICNYGKLTIWVCLKMSCTPVYPMVLLIRQSLWKMAISLGIYPIFRGW